MKYYLAYGSNLNQEQMSHRCPGARIVGTSFIEGYELLYKGSKTGAYLTIERKAGSRVPVAVWAVDARHEAALDQYEGFPSFYYKKSFVVKVKGKKPIDAFAYIMHEERPLGVPAGWYVDVCEHGYWEFGFDVEFLDKAYQKSLLGNSEKNKRRAV